MAALNSSFSLDCIVCNTFCRYEMNNERAYQLLLDERQHWESCFEVAPVVLEATVSEQRRAKIAAESKIKALLQSAFKRKKSMKE
jgi:hypothetical protein